MGRIGYEVVVGLMSMTLCALVCRSFLTYMAHEGRDQRDNAFWATQLAVVMVACLGVAGLIAVGLVVP